VLLAVAYGVAAQERLPSPERYFLGQFGEGWFAELLTLPQRDSLWAAVLVRVAYPLLLFQQDLSHGGLQAAVQVSVEFVDSVGIIRRRLELRDTVWVSTYEATVSRDSSWVRAVEAVIPRDVVRCRVYLLSGPRQLQQREISLRDTQGLLCWQHPLLGSARGDTIVPFVLGGALPFGVHTARLVLWDARLQEGASYTLVCRQVPPDTEERWWDSVPELRSAGHTVRRGRLRLHAAADAPPVLTLSSDTVGGWMEWLLPAAGYVPGQYELMLVRSDTVAADTLRWRFRVRWLGMPVSLRRVSYAVELMSYILTDAEWEELRRGSSQEQWNKLWRYWKRRDPTPATAYNEAMATYFRRVDHAYFAFQSVTEPDGARTDRGKVYILYGAPTRTERRFPADGSPQEEWVYERLRKRFLFELRPDGRWRLVRMEPL
jgi:GWxTD domain-containing protein